MNLKRFWAMGLAVVMTFSIAMTGCSSSDDGQTVGEAQEQTNKDNTKGDYEGEKVLDY